MLSSFSVASLQNRRSFFIKITLFCAYGTRLGTLWPRRFFNEFWLRPSNHLLRFLLTLLPCAGPLGNNNLRGFRCWDGIISATRERIAANEPPQPERRSMEQAVFSHGFCCVLRATGNKTAGDREIR
jgi:hypothetical protein